MIKRRTANFDDVRMVMQRVSLTSLSIGWSWRHGFVYVYEFDGRAFTNTILDEIQISWLRYKTDEAKWWTKFSQL